MKKFLCLLLLFIMSITCWAQRISLNLSNASVVEAFAAIERQTDFLFAYRPGILPSERNVNVNVNNVEIAEALTSVLKNTDLSFSIKGKYIAVAPRMAPATESVSDKIAITGRVLDAITKQPVPAVNVVVKGTTFGATTNTEGLYSLRCKGTDVLVFSFIGYKRQEVSVDERTTIDIELQEEITSLDEVRIGAGYYSTTERTRTGSIVSVTSKDIETQPVTTPMLALAGRLPGIDIAPASGAAGASAAVVIRGRNSISNGAATPLYIIDGIPIDSRTIESNNFLVAGGYTIGGYDPLSTLNPANIESIEVLKDADATAIYGSRGANGVILITTKRSSQTERTSIDLSVYTGVGKIPSSRFVKMLNTQQFVELRKEAFRNDGTTPTVSNAVDILVWDTTRYTDWQKELLGGTSNVTDAQLNVEGGNTFTNFRIGAGYHQEGMIYSGNFGYDRMTININLNHKSSDGKFQVGVTTNTGLENNRLFFGTIADNTIALAPNAPALYDADGNLNWENSTWKNPLVPFSCTDNNRGFNLNLSGNMSYELRRGLVARVNLGYGILNRNGFIRRLPFAAQDPSRIPKDFTAVSNFTNVSRTTWIVEPQLSYATQFGANKSHEIEALAGTTFQESNSGQQRILATGYSSDLLMESLVAAPVTKFDADENLQYRYMAVFGRIGYNYKQKYVVNLTGRRDGSSRFGPNHRWGNFGAVGAGWIFSDEEWMQRLHFLSFGKLRGSYGVTGSDQVGDYKYLSTYKFMPYTYQSQTSLEPTGLVNADYAWEQTRKLEFATQLGFIHDRIRTEVAFYRNRCSNQLLSYQLPGAVGFTDVTQNLDATVQNTGWEISINSVNIDDANFQWTSALNFTVPRNLLVSYPGLEQSTDKYTYTVGKPLTALKLYDFAGVNPTSGLYEVNDIDNNGEINQDDFTTKVDRTRAYYGGLTNSFRFKGVELSILVQFAQTTAENYKFRFLSGAGTNIPLAVYEGRWKEDGMEAEFQKPSFSSAAFKSSQYANNSNGAYSTFAFARVRTLSLSYNFPTKLLEKGHLRTCKVFVQGQNLYTFSNAFFRVDPEIGNLQQPPLLMLTGGIEIKL